MKVHLYTICWDQADMLGFFFRQYDPLVDRYAIYDDGSTDGSLERLRSHPKVTLRQFSRVQDSFMLSHQNLFNEAWKESRGKADWVVVSAVDEHLKVMGQTLMAYLERCMHQAITAISAIGYQMISDEFPAPDELLCETRTLGIQCRGYNRLCVFNPDAIEETGYPIGRHFAEPRGTIRYPARDELMNLHYKFMNFDRVFRRHAVEMKRLGSYDKAQNWGLNWDNRLLRAEWDDVQAHAVPIGQQGFEPWALFDPPRWWRPVDQIDQIDEFAAARYQAAEWQQRCENASRELATTRRDLALADNALHEVLVSTSWRITTPLRRLKQCYERLILRR